MTFAKKTAKMMKKKVINYEALRFAGELEMKKILEDDFALSNYYDIFDKEDEVIEATNTMLTNTVKLNNLMAPRLYSICEEITKYLAFDEEINFYLVSSPEVNAFSINGFGFEPHIICLTSSLINLLNDDELHFVIGHEIGHLIYEHSKLDVVRRILSNREESDISNSLSYNLARWQKYAEVSSDRIGYLVCPDPKVIGKLFFKFAAGLSEDALNFDINAYLKQLDKVKELAVGDFFATHPNNMVRIKSLILFGKSEFLATKTGKREPITRQRLDELVIDYLDILELHPRKEVDKMIVEFFAVAGIYATLTPDGVADSKLYIINEMLGAYTSQPERYLEFTSFDALKRRLNKICKYFAERHDTYKYDLLEKLIYLIISDGRMETEEKALIYEIGKKMRISEYEVTQTIRRMSETYLMPQKRLVP